MMPYDVSQILVLPTLPIRELIRRIDTSAIGIALVVSEDRTLIATVTDGDIRRAFLAGVAIDQPVLDLLAVRGGSAISPTTVTTGTTREAILKLMRSRRLRHIPIVDDRGRVVDIALLERLTDEQESMPLRAVIMAGGKGQRLRPLTASTPKPMLPIGDRPLLERTVEHLRRSGIGTISISTNYLAEKIQSHFGSGAAFGVEIDYLAEDRPLGTAGALSLLRDHPDGPILVMNGDVLSSVNIRAMLDFHRDHSAAVTMAVRPFEVEVPYGVVECQDVEVLTLVEKPRQSFLVNAGIYILEPAVLDLVPRGERHDMPTLIQDARTRGQRVCAFPIREYWIDIGRVSDYERAQLDHSNAININDE